MQNSSELDILLIILFLAFCYYRLAQRLYSVNEKGKRAQLDSLLNLNDDE